MIKHLAVLDRAGLVTSRRAGREVLYTVRPERLGAAAADLAAIARGVGPPPRGDQGAGGGGRVGGEIRVRDDYSVVCDAQIAPDLVDRRLAGRQGGMVARRSCSPAG